MAGGERRLLFDVRGKRKHVIRVVYAILAILMGASLFLVVGPVNIGELIGSGGGGSSAAKIYDERAERIERQLAKDPTNQTLLLSLTRTRIGAGNADVEVDREGGTPVVTPEAIVEYQQGAQVWQRYLKQAGSEPNSGTALLVAGTYFTLAQNSISLNDAVLNLKRAAEAQRIVAAARPSVGSLSTLAIYEYYAGDFAAGDTVSKEAQQRASSKGEKKRIETQLTEYRKRGKELQKQEREQAKAQRAQGKETLENPFRGLGSP